MLPRPWAPARLLLPDWRVSKTTFILRRVCATAISLPPEAQTPLDKTSARTSLECLRMATVIVGLRAAMKSRRPFADQSLPGPAVPDAEYLNSRARLWD